MKTLSEKFDGFIDIQIISFTPGSVVVDAEIIGDVSYDRLSAISNKLTHTQIDKYSV